MKLALLEIFWNRSFVLPALVLCFLVAGLFFDREFFWQVSVAVGLVRLLRESIERIRRGKWNLDYIAMLTLFVAAGLGEWLVGAVISFMVAVSAALEEYGSARAEKTLRELLDRFPKTVMVEISADEIDEQDIHSVKDGDIIFIRPNEMIPLDGELLSLAMLDESSLTGEIGPREYRIGERVRSGSVNVGEMIKISVRGNFERSSYRKILSLVEEGKKRPSDVIRLAEKYNIAFTVVTLLLSFGAYLVFGDMDRFLAVLAIATPCPLLIATPIAFIGGLNRAAREGIIVKSPKILELLTRTRTIFFDKTGTLTLGTPSFQSIRLYDKSLSENEALALASALEVHSFHPVARAFLVELSKRGGKPHRAENVEEKIGQGITGRIRGEWYILKKGKDGSGIAIDFFREKKRIAKFIFQDTLKDDVGKLFRYLEERDYRIGILTGDRPANAKKIFSSFRVPIVADCTPETKAEAVKLYQERGLVGIVGDGMNDAPALALADVGIVFSGTENSASIEAADVAVLGSDAWKIRDIVHIARKSYRTALESILVGIGLSLLGMILAFFGFISPVAAAIIQEVIDALVIVNALRSTY